MPLSDTGRVVPALMDGHNITSTNEKQSNDAESGGNCRMKYELCRH